MRAKDETWPQEVPQPPPDDQWTECRRGSGLWAYSDGSVGIYPYICRKWSCEDHHDEKAARYLESVEQFITELNEIYVGAVDGRWLVGGAERRALESVRKRAARKSDPAPWVKIRAGEDDGGIHVFFAGADLTSRNGGSVVTGAKFVPVSMDQALAMVEHLLNRPSLKVNGSTQTTPRWRPPEIYARDSSTSSNAAHIAGLPEGERGQKKARAIFGIAVELAGDSLTYDERRILREQGPISMSESLRYLTGAEWREYLSEAASLYRKEHQSPTTREEPKASNDMPSSQPNNVSPIKRGYAA
jgi:hypothetical protein